MPRAAHPHAGAHAGAGRNNVSLTLDIKLQEIAEAAFGERRGALVAIEPSTGGILAFVSMPASTRTCSSTHRSAELGRAQQLARPAAQQPRHRRRLPARPTFKPYMALAALELGKRTPRSAINDPGYFEFGGPALPRLEGRRPRARRPVQVDRGLSDTFYYQLANDLGIDAIAGFMGKFGFGSKMASTWRANRRRAALAGMEQSASGARAAEMDAGETISIGIGQGYNAYTPIQLGVALATLAANGNMYRPRLVSHIDNLRTGERRHLEPELLKRLPLRPENVEFVKRAMAGVNKQGTGARAFGNAEYTNGGKTGTAQVVGMKQGEKYDEKKVAERHRDHSLFIVFAPLESPKIALIVIWKTAASARAPRRRSRARCSTITCSASCPCPKRGRGRRQTRRPRPTRKKPTDGTDRPLAAPRAASHGRWHRRPAARDQPVPRRARHRDAVLGELRESRPCDGAAGESVRRPAGDVAGGPDPAANADARRRAGVFARRGAADRGGACRRRSERRAALAARRGYPFPALGDDEARAAHDARLVFPPRTEPRCACATSWWPRCCSRCRCC